MKISIVIPVYNEADSLRACLVAIASQSLKPHEVIVVDNNSSDATCLVAEEFDFVTLIHEKRQGVVHARTKGFDAASGDIIARIDGDSIVPRDWIKSMKTVFSDNRIDAASGQAFYYGVAAASLVNGLDIFIRRRLSLALDNNKMYLWGANMGIRRASWQAVRGSLCQRANQHEDFDIAIHLQEIGHKVVFDDRLKANVSSRRIDMKFMDFMHYVMMSPGTYAQHGIKVKRQMYPVVAICALGYVPGYVLYKGYDPDRDRFSFGRLLSQATGASIARVDPTTYVA